MNWVTVCIIVVKYVTCERCMYLCVYIIPLQLLILLFPRRVWCSPTQESILLVKSFLFLSLASDWLLVKHFVMIFLKDCIKTNSVVYRMSRSFTSKFRDVMQKTVKHYILYRYVTTNSLYLLSTGHTEHVEKGVLAQKRV